MELPSVCSKSPHARGRRRCPEREAVFEWLAAGREWWRGDGASDALQSLDAERHNQPRVIVAWRVVMTIRQRCFDVITAGNTIGQLR